MLIAGRLLEISISSEASGDVYASAFQLGLESGAGIFAVCVASSSSAVVGCLRRCLATSAAGSHAVRCTCRFYRHSGLGDIPSCRSKSSLSLPACDFRRASVTPLALFAAEQCDRAAQLRRGYRFLELSRESIGPLKQGIIACILLMSRRTRWSLTFNPFASHTLRSRLSVRVRLSITHHSEPSHMDTDQRSHTTGNSLI
jgi:hypothetical protein